MAFWAWSSFAFGQAAPHLIGSRRFPMKLLRVILIFAALMGLPRLSWADVMPVIFSGGGSTSFDGWANINSANFSGYGGFPGNSVWPNPIGSNIGASGDSELARVAGSPTGGGPFLASDSIYFGSFAQVPNALGGTLRVSDMTPLPNLKTLVFQIQIGEADSYDFHDPSGYPVLKVNGQANAVGASFEPVLLGRYQNGSFFSPETQQEEPVYVNTWAFQWNLAEGTTVASFQIEFSAVTHAQVYALQLDQTSALQTQQVFSNFKPPPQIRLVSVGAPEFDGLSTFMTHTFSGPAGKTIDLEYSTDLNAATWPVKPGVSTGEGNFLVTITASGDQRPDWGRRMFFRAKYSGN